MERSQPPGRMRSHQGLQDTHWSRGSAYTVTANSTARQFILRTTACISYVAGNQKTLGDTYISAFGQHCSSVSVTWSGQSPSPARSGRRARWSGREGACEERRGKAAGKAGQANAGHSGHTHPWLSPCGHCPSQDFLLVSLDGASGCCQMTRVGIPGNYKCFPGLEESDPALHASSATTLCSLQ